MNKLNLKKYDITYSNNSKLQHKYVYATTEATALSRFMQENGIKGISAKLCPRKNTWVNIINFGRFKYLENFKYVTFFEMHMACWIEDGKAYNVDEDKDGMAIKGNIEFTNIDAAAVQWYETHNKNSKPQLCNVNWADARKNKNIDSLILPNS